MKDFSVEDLTAEAIARMASCPEQRLLHVMERLVTQLHAFVREVEPSPEEWLAAIEFLTRTGQISDHQRQEYILLSDTLGVTMLVDALHQRKHAGATESSVLGPFYVEGAPELPAGANIAQRPGDPLTVRGRVLATDGTPIAGALLDVWQNDANGLYDVQDPGQPQPHLRGRFRTDAEGRYSFRTIRPVSYPIPVDGPVGQLLRRLGRHPYRPAHVHFRVSAEGYRPVTTELFDAGDAYLESDVVFGVKSSLIARFAPHGESDGRPAFLLEYEFGLESQ
jgi:protocatechuate 3,4-dioxygenase beta subunit